MGLNYEFEGDFRPDLLKDQGEGHFEEPAGLFGRLPSDLRKLVRKIVDAPNYDFAAMELLDALHIEWRKP